MTFLLKIATATLVVAGLAVVPGEAKTNPTLKASVPFPFVVGRTVMPPGNYVVDSHVIPCFVTVRNTETQASAVVLSTGLRKSAPVTKGRLIFRREGGRYILSEVWSSGSETGRALPHGRSSRQTRRQPHRLAAAPGSLETAADLF